MTRSAEQTPMSTAQIFEPDGRAIPYIDEGTGPGLVLLPGRGLDVAYLGTLASVLVEEDFRVVRIGSRRPTAGADATLHDLAEDTVDVMDHIGLDHAWIGGHAFGGTVARTVARDHTDHANGVLLLGVEGAAPATDEAARALETVLSDASDEAILAAIPQLAGESVDPQRLWNILGRSRDAAVEGLQRAARAATPEAEWATPAPGIPVLIIQGDDDRITVPENAERLQTAAPELVTLVRVEGGHLVAATHPGETSWVIEDYLDWD